MSKRIHTRLRNLESSSGRHQGLSHDDKKLLVTMLARRDALFWPYRFQPERAEQYGEVLARIREYQSGELGLPVKAAGRGDWKTASDRRQRLIDSRLLSATHGGGQVTSMFLTPAGEAVARGLVGWLASFEECTDVLRRLIVLADHRHNVAVRESLLWQHPCTGNPRTWNHHTEMALPLLTAGVVRATSDVAGRIAYSIVAEADLPELLPTEHEPEPWASDHYLAAFARERENLDSCEARNGLDVAIPLPATGWGEHYQEAEQ